jgi:hypothetical protein
MTRTYLWLFALTLTLLQGCAQQRIANEDELDSKAALKAESFIGDSRNALDDAEEALTRARAEDLEFFTPLHWQQINDAIKTARKEELAGHEQATITASALVTTLLNNAMGFKDKISSRLSDLLAQRLVLLDIRADKVMSKDFSKQDKRIRELASLLESGKDKDISADISETLNDMRDLERTTMLELHWRPAQKTLDKAADEGVDDFAPDTYKAARRMTDNAKDAITEQYQNRDASARIGLEALRAAQHALYIGREAEKIINMDIDDAEQAALRFEGYLNQIAEALNAGDLRNMAFLDQTLALVQKAREQASTLQAPLQKEINSLTHQLNKAKGIDDKPALDEQKTTVAEQKTSTTEQQAATAAAEEQPRPEQKADTDSNTRDIDTVNTDAEPVISTDDNELLDNLSTDADGTPALPVRE